VLRVGMVSARQPERTVADLGPDVKRTTARSRGGGRARASFFGSGRRRSAANPNARQ
jgi:hypothetical protein